VHSKAKSRLSLTHLDLMHYTGLITWPAV